MFFLIVTALAALSQETTPALLVKTDNSSIKSTCSIHYDKTVVSMSLFDQFFQETTYMTAPAYDIRALAPIAIENLSHPTFQWNPTQIGYQVLSPEDTFVEFAAYGMVNIQPNDTGRALKKIADEYCERAQPYKILGEFAIDMTIGEQVIKERLSIKEKNEGFSSQIYGNYHVPNDFDATVDNLKYRDGEVTFSLRVKDERQDFTAFFTAKFTDRDHLQGHVKINGEIFGTFTGQRM